MENNFEKKIIKKIIAGDHAAYAYFMDKYKDMVYSISLKIVGDPTEAEDLAQESFIKAFENLSSFKMDSKFSTWLYAISYRNALYFKRKNKVETQYLLDQDFKRSNENIDSDISDLKHQEQKFFVKQAVDALPEKEGLLVLLYYIDENSIEEIANITGLSQTNIKVKLHRARKKLKKKLHLLLKGDINSIL